MQKSSAVTVNRRRMAVHPTGALALAASFLAAAAPRCLEAHDPVSTRFTFLRDVKPILERRCAGCHSPDRIGPMALSTHAETRPWARAIRSAVLSRRMPPWPVEDGLPLEGARLLDAREIDVLVDWASGGAPEGPPEDAGASPRPGAPAAAAPARTVAAVGGPPAGGPPDLVLRMPAPRVLAPREPGGRSEVLLQPALEAERWLLAWELRPGNPALVHDAWVLIEAPGGARGILGSWTPGQGTVRYPEDAGRRLARGSRLRLAIHHRRGLARRDKEASDQSQLALWFHPSVSGAASGEARPRREVGIEVLSAAPLVLEARAALLGITPRASRECGEGLRLEMLEPGVEVGAGRRLLLEGGPYHPDWPVALRLLEPLDLREGARLELRGPGGEGPPPGIELLLEIAR